MIKATKNFLGLLLLLLLLPMASAFAQPNLTVGSASGAAGATVNTPVTFTNNGAVVAISFDITYDSTKITPGAVTSGTALPPHSIWTSSGTAGKLGITIVTQQPLPDPTKPSPPPTTPTAVNTGILFTVPWTIAASAPAGNVPLALANVIFANAQAAAVSASTLTNGQITIGSSGVVCGDANDSGTLTISDALAIARFKAGLLSQINTTNADVNSIGGVTITDALLIARSLAKLPTAGTCLPQP